MPTQNVAAEWLDLAMEPDFEPGSLETKVESSNPGEERGNGIAHTTPSTVGRPNDQHIVARRSRLEEPGTGSAAILTLAFSTLNWTVYRSIWAGLGPKRGVQCA